MRKLRLDDLDKECVEFCEALNLLPGIRTTESCCGHGKQPYRIWFKARSLAALPPALYWLDGCHCGHYGWRVFVGTDCLMAPVCFMVEGPVGEEAYEQSKENAALIRQFVRQEGKERANA